MENKFVNYLNTLHSYSGHNANVFGEKNVENEFYKSMMVEVPLCDFIINELTNKAPHIVMLTGHAGDGKTSLMFQVLEKMGCTFDNRSDRFEVKTKNGNSVVCIKDFSEFPDDEKLTLMKESKEQQDAGKYVFMVANTGPLITIFSKMFPENIQAEMEGKFIDAMDKNSGTTVEIGGYKVCIINIVNVENSYFAPEFIDKVVNNHEWDKCSNCPKAGYCHILRNIKLLKDNKTNTIDFISKHYAWLNEYGTRLTIRNMTQQLAFMITGGVDCNNIKQHESYMYLYSNLFFGYVGTRIDDMAQKIYAIGESRKCGYDQKRLRVDETLFIKEDFSSVFSKTIVDIINEMQKNNGNINGLNSLLRRMYFFYNTSIDLARDTEDIFSRQFGRYIELKNTGAQPTAKDNDLIKRALNMIYTGSAKYSNHGIPVTLSRESGYTQNVQYVIDTLKTNKIKLISEASDQFGGYGKKQIRLVIQIDKTKLKQTINLPLLDYFEDLKDGIINTNIDAQLSKGIENIKSEILDIVLEDVADDEDFMLIVLGNGEFESVSFTISDGRIS